MLNNGDKGAQVTSLRAGQRSRDQRSTDHVTTTNDVERELLPHGGLLAKCEIVQGFLSHELYIHRPSLYIHYVNNDAIILLSKHFSNHQTHSRWLLSLEAWSSLRIPRNLFPAWKLENLLMACTPCKLNACDMLVILVIYCALVHGNQHNNLWPTAILLARNVGEGSKFATISAKFVKLTD